MTATRKPGAELSIRAWAAELEAAATIVRQLAGTAFIPASLKRFQADSNGRPLDGKDGRDYVLDVDATTATGSAAIMTGQELGLDVMASLRSIAIINDTPALNALTLRAILQSQGHGIYVAESTATRAVVRVRRAGEPEWQDAIWTLDRAKTAGLYPGPERGSWRKNPTAMLVARATAEGAKWIAADAILGIPYVAEELIDALEAPEAEQLAITAGPGDADGQAQREPTSRKRTTKRRAAERVPALPAGPPLPAAAQTAPAAKAGKPSKAQFDKLHAALREGGFADPAERDQALALISTWAGRPISSTTELDADEAGRVLDGLAALRSIAAAQQRAEADAAHEDAEGSQGEAGDDPA